LGVVVLDALDAQGGRIVVYRGDERFPMTISSNSRKARLNE
jgi:hypothetical protein